MSKRKYSEKEKIVDDILFDSTMEARYYILLKEKKENKEIRDFVLQPEFKLLDAYIVVNNKVITEDEKDYAKLKKSKKKTRDVQGMTYIADFLVTYNDGKEIVIDVKGMETEKFTVKRKLFDTIYRDKTLKLVTQYNGIWYDADELKKIKAQRKRDRTKKKKDRAKEILNKKLSKLDSKKLNDDKHIETITKEFKILTAREIERIINSFKEK